MAKKDYEKNGGSGDSSKPNVAKAGYNKMITGAVKGFKTVTTTTTDKRTGLTTTTKSRQRKGCKAAGKLVNPKKRYGV